MRYSFGKKYHSAFEEFNSLVKDQPAENINLIIKLLITWLNDLQKYKLDLNNYLFKEHEKTLEKFNSKFPNAKIEESVFNLDIISSYLNNNINTSVLTSNIIFELASLTD